MKKDTAISRPAPDRPDVLHTTGFMRRALLQTILDVRDDKIPLDHANTIVQLANSINGTINAETRARAVAIMAGEQLSHFGTLLIGDVPDGQSHRLIEQEEVP